MTTPEPPAASMTATFGDTREGTMGIRKNRVAVAGATTMAVLVGGVAYGAIGPAADGTIRACVNTTSGAIRMVDPATPTCASGETATWWAQRGRTGPTGPQGPQGQQGPAGDAKRHWIRLNADGSVSAASRTDASIWDGRSRGADGYVYFPGIDPAKCALTVTPLATTAARTVIGMRVIYNAPGYFRFSTSEAGSVVAVPVDLTVHC